MSKTWANSPEGQGSNSCGGLLSSVPAEAAGHPRVSRRWVQRGGGALPLPHLPTANRRQLLSAGLGFSKPGQGVLRRGHRNTEWFGWEGTLQTIQFQPPAISRDIFHQPRVLKAPSNLALNPAREGAATASVGNLGQGLTTLTGKNFFPISHLNLPSVSLEPFPLVLSLHLLVKSPSLSFLSTLPGTGSCSKVTPEEWRYFCGGAPALGSEMVKRSVQQCPARAGPPVTVGARWRGGSSRLGHRASLLGSGDGRSSERAVRQRRWFFANSLR